MIKYFALFVQALLLSLLLYNCQSTQEEGSEKKLIVCTTGMIGDLAKNIAGDNFEVKALMGPGVDPHLYKATRQDLSLLREGNIIFFNGLHLEGKMAEILEKLGERKPVYAVTDGLESQDILAADGAADPHIWFDVKRWQKALDLVEAKLIEHYPDQAKTFQTNASEYRRTLQDLDQEVEKAIQSIPEKGRVLITAHDAFTYFGDSYGIEVRGLQGISTLSEFGLKDVKNLVDFIIEREIKAVFVETSIPAKSLEAVVRACQEKKHRVKIGGALYSDAMGEVGKPEGTYVGMVRANVNTIVEALK